jgi:hypothetical protein
VIGEPPDLLKRSLKLGRLVLQIVANAVESQLVANAGRNGEQDQHGDGRRNRHIGEAAVPIGFEYGAFGDAEHDQQRIFVGRPVRHQPVDAIDGAAAPVGAGADGPVDTDGRAVGCSTWGGRRPATNCCIRFRPLRNS